MQEVLLVLLLVLVFLLSDYRGYKNLSASVRKQSGMTCQILALPEAPPLNALSKLNNCINHGGRGQESAHRQLLWSSW